MSTHKSLKKKKKKKSFFFVGNLTTKDRRPLRKNAELLFVCPFKTKLIVHKKKKKKSFSFFCLRLKFFDSKKEKILES